MGSVPPQPENNAPVTERGDSQLFQGAWLVRGLLLELLQVAQASPKETETCQTVWWKSTGSLEDLNMN